MGEEPRRGYLPYLEINVLTRNLVCDTSIHAHLLGVLESQIITFSRPQPERPSSPWRLCIYSSASEPLPWLIYRITHNESEQK